jgi:hypothetical protein
MLMSPLGNFQQRIIADGNRARKAVLEQGRYPVDMLTGLLNKYRREDKPVFTTSLLGGRLRELEKSGKPTGFRMARHKIGSVQINSLDEGGVLTVLGHYHRLGEIGEYSLVEVKKLLAEKKDRYLKLGKPYSFF